MACCLVHSQRFAAAEKYARQGPILHHVIQFAPPEGLYFVLPLAEKWRLLSRADDGNS